MNPNPFSELNHFTTPVAMQPLLRYESALIGRPQQTVVPNRRCAAVGVHGRPGFAAPRPSAGMLDHLTSRADATAYLKDALDEPGVPGLDRFHLIGSDEVV